MENKICPIMSRNDRGKVGFVECQQDKCALWVALCDYEGTHPIGYENGCAFALGARKDASGKIQA